MTFTEFIHNNRYRILREIGRGGMGTVYEANDTSLDRTVAIKVLPTHLMNDEESRARFRKEIFTTARLDHPHIVHLFDVGEEKETIYYVMQFIAGANLRDMMAQREEPYPLPAACAILSQAAKALDYAHGQQLVHRDIKPDNILLDEQNNTYLSDFGIVRTLEGTQHTVGLIGTPEYMSPEQCRGGQLTGASDQYSLAVIAYQMLTGTTPFRKDASEPWMVVNAHLSCPPPNPREFNPAISEEAAHALQRALAKMPQFRFPTCIDFTEALSCCEKPMKSSDTAQTMLIAEKTLLEMPPVPSPLAASPRFAGQPQENRQNDFQPFTPGMVKAEPEYATFPQRALAAMLDVILVFFACWGLSFLAMTAGEGIFGQGANDLSMMFASNVLLLFVLFYYTGLEASRLSATPGKLLLGLAVTDVRGQKISYGQSMGRFLLKSLCLITLFIGFLFVAFTRRKQGLHDMLAGTTVIQKRREPAAHT